MFNQENKGKEMAEQNESALLAFTESEVTSLLEAYEAYKKLSREIQEGKTSVQSPTFSFSKNLGTMQNLDPLSGAKKKLEQIGESMKFQNPLIWLLYKERAYRDEPGNALTTLRDLISHCKTDGICHKRFDSINAYLRSKHAGKDMLTEDFMSGAMALEEVAKDRRFLDMCLDGNFHTLWSENENNSKGKWATYVPKK